MWVAGGCGTHRVGVAADVWELVGADVEDEVHVRVCLLLGWARVVVHSKDELEALHRHCPVLDRPLPGCSVVDGYWGLQPDS